MYYFIYKMLQVTGIGGCSIPTVEGINGGQGSYKEWLLGTTDDYNKLLLIKEFQPRLVPESVWLGFSLIGKTQISEMGAGVEPKLRDLTVEEIQQQNDATNWELKENLRWLIEIGVGDGLDQLADVSKQLQLITGMVVRMYRAQRLVLEKALVEKTIFAEEVSAIIPPETKAGYDNFADMYAKVVADGTYKDRTDIEDPAVLIPKLMELNNKIQQLVKSKYFDKIIS